MGVRQVWETCWQSALAQAWPSLSSSFTCNGLHNQNVVSAEPLIMWDWAQLATFRLACVPASKNRLGVDGLREGGRDRWRWHGGRGFVNNIAVTALVIGCLKES